MRLEASFARAIGGQAMALRSSPQGASKGTAGSGAYRVGERHGAGHASASGAEAPLLGPAPFSLEAQGITVARVLRNPSPAVLYEEALRHDPGTALASSGALIALSGQKTGRSPTDKRIVHEPENAADVWWGKVNAPVTEQAFLQSRQRAIDFLNTQPQLYVIDGFAGWDPAHRLRVRVICARAYHALFMRNVLVRPTAPESNGFEPDAVIYNAGQFPANRYTEGMTSTTSICLSLRRKQLVILGTEYAGEMKKGVFTLMNYLMPKAGVLSMHCSATEGIAGDVSVLFGLSGTGKTTLSADPHRLLIGDDEHCWSERGIFNIEGGCYAKAIDLSPEAEPDIYRALHFGAVLENVMFDPASRTVDYADGRITQNTRGCYPIEYVESAKLPCMGGHPKNVIFLTCDAFGVLPPVARLTSPQAMYHYVSGYTAKVAGTEMGVVAPEATFSPCFGGPFLVLHPLEYAELLAERLRHHGASTWLVNTGWTGGGYGTGQRMRLSYTRAILDAIHEGALERASTRLDPIFGLAIPTACPGVPADLLDPRRTWRDPAAYDEAARRLAQAFNRNFASYAERASEDVKAAAPRAS
jgi:phosphoenolpyruvate carboxykinase (ATP)